MQQNSIEIFNQLVSDYILSQLKLGCNKNVFREQLALIFILQFIPEEIF